MAKKKHGKKKHGKKRSHTKIDKKCLEKSVHKLKGASVTTKKIAQLEKACRVKKDRNGKRIWVCKSCKRPRG
jgi:hypothetical protein